VTDVGVSMNLMCRKDFVIPDSQREIQYSRIVILYFSISFYGLGGSGIESRWGAKFSAPIQTGPGSHPASCTMGAGCFPGVKRPGRGVDHPPPCSAEVKERLQLYIYCPSAFVVCSRVNCTLLSAVSSWVEDCFSVGVG